MGDRMVSVTVTLRERDPDDPTVFLSESVHEHRYAEDARGVHLDHNDGSTTLVPGAPCSVSTANAATASTADERPQHDPLPGGRHHRLGHKCAPVPPTHFSREKLRFRRKTRETLVWGLRGGCGSRGGASPGGAWCERGSVAGRAVEQARCGSFADGSAGARLGASRGRRDLPEVRGRRAGGLLAAGREGLRLSGVPRAVHV
jgi:hypothetical protein